MESKRRVPEVALLMTGNELVTGELTDTNSVFMAQQLVQAGVVVRRIITTGDDFAVLTASLESLSRENDVVIVNGGMGSTVDDLTAEVAALVSGTRLVERPEAIAHISSRFGEEIVSRNARYFNQIRKQALIPESAELLDNVIGLALGFKLRINRAICYFTPGVPREMKEMFSQVILPEILNAFELRTNRRTSRLNIAGIGESRIQQLINRNVPAELLENIEVGFRAKMTYVELKLTIEGNEHESALAVVLDHVRSVLSDYIFSESEPLPESLIGELRRQNLRLALAESCTGGLIASQITAVPGASDVFEAGLVTYSNRAKLRLLGVSDELLAEFGAVSPQVATAMAEGVMEATGADVAAAVTGIAGPTGGTEEKPVGTVYIAWGRSGDVQTRLMQVKRSRTIFQQLVCSAVLDILRRYILGLDTNGIYYFDDISRKRLRFDQ